MDYFKRYPQHQSALGQCITVASVDPGYEYPLQFTDTEIFELFYQIRSWDLVVNLNFHFEPVDEGVDPTDESYAFVADIVKTIDTPDASRLSCNGPHSWVLSPSVPPELTGGQSLGFLFFQYTNFDSRFLVNPAFTTFYSKCNLTLIPRTPGAVRIWNRNFGGDDVPTGITWFLEMMSGVKNLPMFYLDPPTSIDGTTTVTGTVTSSITATY